MRFWRFCVRVWFWTLCALWFALRFSFVRFAFCGSGSVKNLLWELKGFAKGSSYPPSREASFAPAIPPAEPIIDDCWHEGALDLALEQYCVETRKGQRKYHWPGPGSVMVTQLWWHISYEDRIIVINPCSRIVSIELSLDPNPNVRLGVMRGWTIAGRCAESWESPDHSQ